jgi:hypothetical protein
LPSACGWCHQPPQGTRTPELLVMSRAHRACGSPAHGSPTSFTGWHTQSWVSSFLSGGRRRSWYTIRS